jgi:hypothetical protein
MATEVGIYTYEVEMHYTNFPGRSVTKTVTVDVTPCVVTSMNFSPTPTDV